MFFAREGGELDEEFFLRVETGEEVEVGEGGGEGGWVEGEDVACCWGVWCSGGLQDDEFAYFEEGFAGEDALCCGCGGVFGV